MSFPEKNELNGITDYALLLAIFGLWAIIVFPGEVLAKLRQKLSDAIKPELVYEDEEHNLVERFCELEFALRTGKVIVKERSAFISSLAHMEQELAEYRQLGADIRRLRSEKEEPKRKAAIEATREKLRLREELDNE